MACECSRGPSVVTDWARGDMVCSGCGVVLESHLMDESTEWQEWPAAVPVAAAAAAAAAASVPRARVRDAEEVRERWVGEGLRDLDRVMGCFGQSTTGSIAARARELFGDLAAAKAAAGDRGALVAAAAYNAFKMEGVGRELHVVCETCGVEPAHMRAALDEYKERLVGKAYYPALFSRVTADALLGVALDRLEAAGALSAVGRKEVWRAATRLAGRLEHVMDCGRKPKTLCCGIVYLACQAAMPARAVVAKKDVAAACGVCQQTLDKIVAYIRARAAAATSEPL